MLLRRTTLLAAVVAAPLTMAREGNYEGEAELGMLITSGNSEETSINSRLAGKYEGAVWRNTASFRSAYSEGKDETTAEKYRVDAEGNYKFGAHQYWFLRGSYDDDRFSGYEYDVFTDRHPAVLDSKRLFSGQRRRPGQLLGHARQALCFADRMG
jgi:putative salt-induced outer membrane protein YdiY